jgi:hypothetical protein
LNNYEIENLKIPLVIGSAADSRLTVPEPAYEENNKGTFLVLLVYFHKRFCYTLAMPRKARIDAPGAIHHIIVRGAVRKLMVSCTEVARNLNISKTSVSRAVNIGRKLPDPRKIQRDLLNV